MAGLAIEVKCKDIKPYRLGGVQKVEFERHKVDDDLSFDYITTTVYDTKHYAYEDVEYIKVFGGAVVTTDDELQYILHFAENEDFFFEAIRKQLRSLWTSYCLHKGFVVDEQQYDVRLFCVWEVVLKNESNPWKDGEDGVVGFELFDTYMCEEMV